MSKKKEKHGHKTNAIRMVEAEGIPYKMYTYDAPDGFLDGVSVAKSLGQDLDRVFKTLVTEGSSREHYVCVIPVAKELDLKKAAKHFGEKKVEMLPSKELTRVTGYVKGGCSPVGMKKLLPTKARLIGGRPGCRCLSQPAREDTKIRRNTRKKLCRKTK